MIEALLAALDGIRDRSARFRTSIALVTKTGVEVVADGHLDGVITDAPRGNSGFGYDPIFEVDGRTLAEMSASDKDEISHRGRALRALVAAIRSA